MLEVHESEPKRSWNSFNRARINIAMEIIQLHPYVVSLWPSASAALVALLALVSDPPISSLVEDPI